MYLLWPDDDEFMNAMLFGLQIQICIGQAAGTPVARWPSIPRSTGVQGCRDRNSLECRIFFAGSYRKVLV
jgi:hypothetical protein